MQLSKHFHLSEFTTSNTAKRLGIHNHPNERQTRNLKKLCNTLLEPVRVFFDRPITINSGYRCSALNQAVGGVDNSVHTMGLAADLVVSKEDQSRIMMWLKQSTIPFDQAIAYPSRGFIHIGLSPQNTPRKQLLISTTKRVYQHYA